MPLWNMNDWTYLERQVVADPKGRRWSVALMDLLGQKGDPEMPSELLEMQYASGRYFTLVYSADGGAIQFERGYQSLWDATEAYGLLLASVADGSFNPSQPVFRADLDE